MSAVRLFKMFLLTLLALPLMASAGEKFKPETALALDVVGNAVIAHPGRIVDDKMGIGGNLTFEYRPISIFAIGTQIGGREFPGDKNWKAMAWDLDAKIFPLGRSTKGEMYLEGGAGEIIPKKNDVDTYKWRTHGTLAAGYRFFCKSSQSRFLDLAVVYDTYSPSKTPLSTLGVKVGLGWNFGSNRPKPGVKTERVKASTTMRGKNSSKDEVTIDPKTGKRVKVRAVKPGSKDALDVDSSVSDLKGKRTIVYKVQKGECLWKISGKEEIYNDGTQWPRIYKANRDQIHDPNLIYPRQKLKVIDPNKALSDKDAK